MRLALALLFFFPSFLWAQSSAQEELKKLAWQRGPVEGRIAGKATIKVPQGYVFLDEKNTRRFLELAGNPPRDGNYLFAPDTLDWFAVFNFDTTGYVKDDEKIDPDNLLKQLMASDAPENQERKRLGMQEIYTVGWEVPPHYDTETKRLEWGVRLKTASGHFVVNYTSRLLGRSGVMSAILVGDPATLGRDVESFKGGLREFSYLSGEKYAEFKSGDKVAEYGLAALIVGGAAAVATKKGFWAALIAFLGAFWKLIVGVGVAVLAWLGKLFKGKQQQ
jgi:uncharacterized membrane-anchored protein